MTSALHALHLWDLQHFVVIIKTSSPPSNSKAWFVFINFQISDTYLMDMGLDINLLGHLMAMFTHNFCWNLMIFCLEQVDFLQHVCIDFLVLFTNVLGISFSFSTWRPPKFVCSGTCGLARWIDPRLVYEFFNSYDPQMLNYSQFSLRCWFCKFFGYEYRQAWSSFCLCSVMLPNESTPFFSRNSS